MNFYTLFTRTENVHLLKDVGMIPESLARKYPEIHSYLVTYKNGEYSYIGNEIKNTQLIFLNKKSGKYFDGVRFIRQNADKIDVLNIYHLNLSSFLYCIAAKIYLKRGAKVYLKTDVGPDEMRKLRMHNLRSWIKRKTIKMADVVTGETTVLVKQLQEEVDTKIKLIPNGYYAADISPADEKKKMNRIITVGRLGTVPKNTELLVDAFIKSMDNHDWELRLIGPSTDEFRKKITSLCLENPKLQTRLSMSGEITDKWQLAAEYEKAKVFVLPSKWESFGLVLLEALKAGDYIVTSDNVPAAYDIIYDERAGQILKENTLEAWANAIIEVTRKEMDWSIMCQKGFQVAEQNYNWDIIAEKIYDLLKKA